MIAARIQVHFSLLCDHNSEARPSALVRLGQAYRRGGPVVNGIVLRVMLAAAVAFVAFVALVSVSLAQWPTACVDLNDVVELQLGNNQNAGIYQRVFLSADAERACQGDHRGDVRATFAWAFDGAAPAADLPSTAWPTSCVGLNDFVEAHLGNTGYVGIYQRAFGDGPAAESACRSDHHADVQAVFAWAYGPPVARPPRLSLLGGSPMALEDMADIMLASPWADAMVFLEVPEGGDWIGCGSGFIVTSDGYVVTNHHVISEGPGWADVRNASGFIGRASVVASDPELDIALLKLLDDGGPYWFLGFGSSAALRSGDGVMIVGYPGCGSSGGRLTASWGGVTVIGVRDWDLDTGYRRQTFRSNAPVEKGSSGSPVMDQRGRVVGVHWGTVDDEGSHVPGDRARQTIAAWITGMLPPVSAPAGPTPVPPQGPTPVLARPTPAPYNPSASQSVVDALGRAGDALEDHFDATDDFNDELDRAVRALDWGDEFTAASALRSAADDLETAARELNTAASEFSTVIFLLRAHSLPNHQWAFYLEYAAGDLRRAAGHLRDAAFNYRQASWNLGGSQAASDITNANWALDSHESSISSASSNLELWSIWTS